MTIEVLEQERDKIMLRKLMGFTTDFSYLRKICKEFSSKTDFIFETEGTDQELWDSVNKYFREILAKKTT